MSLRKETEVPSLSAHLYSQNGQFTPAVPGSPYNMKEARAALIPIEYTDGKAYMYFRAVSFTLYSSVSAECTCLPVLSILLFV